jgi:hypothetical protein
LNNNGGATTIASKTAPNFSTIAATNEGMYATTDDYGTSYYFRGAVNNNWVSFAGFYWRIIRVNGDGSVRMIYTGSTAPTESQAVVMTGENTMISTTIFNNDNNNNMYVGYMYTSDEVHGYSNNSTIKTLVDTWYTNNLTSYSSKLEDIIYCNDRSPYTGINGETLGGGSGTIETYYGPRIRLITNKAPQLTCPIQSDAFTVSDTTKGNGHLTNPIGLITADELSFAGGLFNNENNNYYLYVNQKYWTISPCDYYIGSYSSTFMIFAPGTITATFSGDAGGVRPVISLKSTITATGTGVWNDPYIVQ